MFEVSGEDFHGLSEHCKLESNWVHELVCEILDVDESLRQHLPLVLLLNENNLDDQVLVQILMAKREPKDLIELRVDAVHILLRLLLETPELDANEALAI